MNIEEIYNEFIESNEAVDAEVTSSGVMLSKEDCLTLMSIAVDMVDPVGGIPYDSLSDSFKKSIDSIEKALNRKL
tara:strand:- start:241 stop:465 length:225 start_codon:yes stop_codon:yes gene_type:complete